MHSLGLIISNSFLYSTEFTCSKTRACVSPYLIDKIKIYLTISSNLTVLFCPLKAINIFISLFIFLNLTFIYKGKIYLALVTSQHMAMSWMCSYFQKLRNTFHDQSFVHIYNSIPNLYFVYEIPPDQILNFFIIVINLASLLWLLGENFWTLYYQLPFLHLYNFV